MGIMVAQWLVCRLGGMCFSTEAKLTKNEPVLSDLPRIDWIPGKVKITTVIMTTPPVVFRVGYTNMDASTIN